LYRDSIAYTTLQEGVISKFFINTT